MVQKLAPKPNAHPCRVLSERSTKPGSKFVGGMSVKHRWFLEGAEQTEHPFKSLLLLFYFQPLFPSLVLMDSSDSIQPAESIQVSKKNSSLIGVDSL